jgi:hypothetical protein
VHPWLAAQLRWSRRVEAHGELYYDGPGPNKCPYRLDVKDLGIRRLAPPAPDCRTDGHGQVLRQRIKVEGSPCPHAVSPVPSQPTSECCPCKPPVVMDDHDTDAARRTALLLAPAADHQIVEAGEDTEEVLHFPTPLMG